MIHKLPRFEGQQVVQQQGGERAEASVGKSVSEFAMRVSLRYVQLTRCVAIASIAFDLNKKRKTG